MFPARSPLPEPAASRGELRTLLVVEDDAIVRGVLVNLLSGAGYTVLEAADGAEALRLVREHAGTIDLLLTDLLTPGVGAAGGAEPLRALRPGLCVLVLTGQPLAGLPEGVSFLRKPCTAAALSSK